MANPRAFKQVDVFTAVEFLGNPLAVVLEGDGLTDAEMQTIARWTNLSETTFVLPPADPGADYRVRIFTTEYEVPFAGHPTLGTAHALLESGLQPNDPTMIIQECGVGLVAIKRSADGTLAFQSPPAQQRPLDRSLWPTVESALGGVAIEGEPIAVDMGIKWIVARLPSAQTCLDVQGNAEALRHLSAECDGAGLAIFGPHPAGGPADYEVRALFAEGGSLVEDPVTGSANACIARVLQTQGFPDGFTTGYEVRQGTVLHRDGQVSVQYVDGEPWIGGRAITVITGQIQAAS